MTNNYENFENSDLFSEFLNFLINPPSTVEEADDRILTFHNFLTNRCLVFYRQHGLEPMFCGSNPDDTDHNHNVETIFECFIHDFHRMKEDSLSYESGKPDHFKQAGILAYWLRRYPIAYSFFEIGFEKEHLSLDTYNEFPSKKIIDILTRRKSEPEDVEEIKRIKEKYFPWLLMYRYHEAYFAFHLGLDICHRFEREEEKSRPKAPKDFLHMVCHFLKYKNVSPHGLTIIYEALYQTINKK